MTINSTTEPDITYTHCWQQMYSYNFRHVTLLAAFRISASLTSAVIIIIIIISTSNLFLLFLIFSHPRFYIIIIIIIIIIIKSAQTLYDCIWLTWHTINAKSVQKSLSPKSAVLQTIQIHKRNVLTVRDHTCCPPHGRHEEMIAVSLVLNYITLNILQTRNVKPDIKIPRININKCAIKCNKLTTLRICSLYDTVWNDEQVIQHQTKCEINWLVQKLSLQN